MAQLSYCQRCYLSFPTSLPVGLKRTKGPEEEGTNAHFQPNLFNLNGGEGGKEGIETRRHGGISDMIEAGGGGCLIA